MGTTEVSFPGLGFTVEVNKIAFSIGSLDVYWYGIIIAAAMLVCCLLALKHVKANKFSQDLVYDTMLLALPCAVVGARAYYVICEWEYYSQDLKRIFDTRAGGLAVYGGIIGACLGVYVMCRIRKIPFSCILDYCLPYVPLGQAIGRWGNFFNQEAFGTTTNLPWGMTSSTVQSYLKNHYPNLDYNQPVHPTFLYESLWNLMLFFVLLQVRKKSNYKFETSCVYLIGYGVARFLIEGLRTDSLYIGNTGIRTSQLLSLIMVLFGLVYIAVAHYKDLKKENLPERFLVEGEAKK